MQAAQTTAIGVPQKMLVRGGEGGAVFISYNGSAYLGEQHGLGDQVGLGAVADALSELTEVAT